MWWRVVRQPVMIPGILRRRGMGFLPTETGGGGDTGGFWDSFPWDQFPVDYGGNQGLDIFFNGSDFLPTYGPGSQDASVAPAPGVCPRGTYHPPNDPYACIPFPGSATGTTPARPTPQGTPRPQPTAAGACPKPFVYDPKTKKCVLPPCPQGQTFSITAGKCVPNAQLKPADRVIDREFPWWLIVAGGVLLLAITKPTGGRR